MRFTTNYLKFNRDTQNSLPGTNHPKCGYQWLNFQGVSIIWLQKLPPNKSGTKQKEVKRGNSDSTCIFFVVSEVCGIFVPPFFLRETSPTQRFSLSHCYGCTDFGGTLLRPQVLREMIHTWTDAHIPFSFMSGETTHQVQYTTCWHVMSFLKYLRKSSLELLPRLVRKCIPATRDIHFKMVISIG